MVDHNAEEIDELRQLIGRACISQESVKEKYLRAFVHEGFESVQSLEAATIDDFKSMGFRTGHARCIMREIANWLPRHVPLRCCRDEKHLRLVEVKMITSLQTLRSIINKIYPDRPFVFVSKETALDREQEALPICKFYSGENAAIDIDFLDGKSTR